MVLLYLNFELIVTFLINYCICEQFVFSHKTKKKSQETMYMFRFLHLFQFLVLNCSQKKIVKKKIDNDEKILYLKKTIKMDSIFFSFFSCFLLL